MRKPLVLALGITALTALPAWTCGFHNYTPQPTIVEKMLNGSVVVLARQSAVSPFNFEIVEVLSGTPPQDRIPFLVDSETRRKFDVSDAAVLFTFDETEGEWQRLAMVDETVRPVVDGVVHNLPEWRLGGDMERAAMFSLLINHPSRTVRELALKELDRADYSILRSQLIPVDTNAILSEIDIPEETHLEPIRALLLGLSYDPSAEAALQRGVNNNLGGTDAKLGAYATAWIELSGESAINQLASLVANNRTLGETSDELIAEAFALHSSYGDPEIAEAVRSNLASAIARRPELAVPAARRFMAKFDWSLRDAITGALDTTTMFTAEEHNVLETYAIASGQVIDFSQ